MMVLAGGAYAALVVSSFSRAQKRVLDMGFADDINTYVMISGKETIQYFFVRCFSFVHTVEAEFGLF